MAEDKKPPKGAAKDAKNPKLKAWIWASGEQHQHPALVDDGLMEF